VQPERNPLRPGNYVRALFGVVYGVGVPLEVARLWLTPMQEEFGPLLAREYRRVSEELRAYGVRPLHYVTAGRSRFADLAGDEPSMHARVDATESFLAPMAQEALPGIDSSMWDSLRPESPLGASEPRDAAPDELPQTVRGLGHESPQVSEPPRIVRDAPAPPPREDAAAASEPQPPAGGATALETTLSVGDWVDIEGAHGVVRTQLTWLSPRNTLFLFTPADGSTQSMTSRMVSRLLQSGAMKRVAA